MVGGVNTFSASNWKLGRKVEIIDMKNESFACNGIEDFPLPDMFDAFNSGAGGLVEGNVPLVCGRRYDSQCFALKNRKWEFVTMLKVPRIQFGSGKCLRCFSQFCKLILNSQL